MQTPPSQPHHYPVLSLMMYTCKSKLKLNDRSQRESLRNLLAPALFGGNFNHLSPYGVYQYAIEPLAGTWPRVPIRTRLPRIHPTTRRPRR